MILPSLAVALATAPVAVATVPVATLPVVTSVPVAVPSAPAPIVTSVPALAPSSAPTAAPVAATAAPQTAPSPAGTPVNYAYRFVPYPPTDPEAPRIFAVYMNDKTLRAPGPIDIRIDTSPDVTSVVEETGKNSYPIPMAAPGRFASYSQLPKVPFIAHGIQVKLVFVAKNASGKTTTVTVPFTIK